MAAYPVEEVVGYRLRSTLIQSDDVQPKPDDGPSPEPAQPGQDEPGAQARQASGPGEAGKSVVSASKKLPGTGDRSGQMLLVALGTSALIGFALLLAAHSRSRKREG